jgi:hypothetical protein
VMPWGRERMKDWAYRTIVKVREPIWRRTR